MLDPDRIKRVLQLLNQSSSRLKAERPPRCAQSDGSLFSPTVRGLGRPTMVLLKRQLRRKVWYECRDWLPRGTTLHER